MHERLPLAWLHDERRVVGEAAEQDANRIHMTRVDAMKVRLGHPLHEARDHFGLRLGDTPRVRSHEDALAFDLDQATIITVWRG